jgi:RimJ/RimL family protein N-acetyltransferase
MVVPRFFEKALGGRPITVYGDGRQTRDFTHISDTIEACIRVGRQVRGCEIFNVANEQEDTIGNVAELIKSLTGSTSDIHYIEALSQVHSPADMVAYVEAALAELEAGQSLPFATLDRQSGRVVGSTRFGSLDRRNLRVEIGWTWIARPWQRSPVNTEAKYLMLRYAFEELGCMRVELKTDALNERSRRAIARLGAVEEGVLRSHMVTAHGRVRDTVYYSIIAPEWPAVRARLEQRV